MSKSNFPEEIVALWNSGKREEAKVLFMKVQMILPMKIKLFLKMKMKLCFDQRGIYIYKQNHE